MSPPSQPLAVAQPMVDIEHRNQFNLAAFGTSFEVGNTASVPKDKKKVPTKERYNEIVRLVRYWDSDDGHTDPVTGEHVSKYELRKSCLPHWYKEVKLYRIYSTTTDGASVEELHHIDLKTNTWKVVVHQEMVFDVISKSVILQLNTRK